MWSVDADLRIAQGSDNISNQSSLEGASGSCEASTLPDCVRVQALLETKNQIPTFSEIFWGPLR